MHQSLVHIYTHTQSTLFLLKCISIVIGSDGWEREWKTDFKSIYIGLAFHSTFMFKISHFQSFATEYLWMCIHMWMWMCDCDCIYNNQAKCAYLCIHSIYKIYINILELNLNWIDLTIWLNIYIFCIRFDISGKRRLRAYTRTHVLCMYFMLHRCVCIYIYIFSIYVSLRSIEPLLWSEIISVFVVCSSSKTSEVVWDHCWAERERKKHGKKVSTVSQQHQKMLFGWCNISRNNCGTRKSQSNHSGCVCVRVLLL